MFGFGKPRCEKCKMELKSGVETHEWQDKKFCCQECKRAHRVGSSNSGKCH